MTFTDATVTERGIRHGATAERSPDAVTDGSVTGSVVGVLDESGGCRWTELRDADGGGLGKVKAEGICAARSPGVRLYLVTDADDPASPSELLTVAWSDPWTY